MYYFTVLDRIITVLDYSWAIPVNGLLPGWRQAIIRTNGGIMLIQTLGTNFSEIFNEIHSFSLKKCIWKCNLWNGSHFVSTSMCYRKYSSWCLSQRVQLTISQHWSLHWLCAKLMTDVNVMMTSSNGNIFRITGPLCREFTSHRRIPRTKASDVELWCFLWSATE